MVRILVARNEEDSFGNPNSQPDDKGEGAPQKPIKTDYGSIRFHSK